MNTEITGAQKDDDIYIFLDDIFPLYITKFRSFL